MDNSFEPLLKNRFLVQFHKTGLSESTIRSEWVRNVKYSFKKKKTVLKITITPDVAIEVAELREIDLIKVFFLGPDGNVTSSYIFSGADLIKVELENDYANCGLLEYKLKIKIKQ